MQNVEATKQLVSAVAVTREDIARAKSYLLKTEGGRTEELADQWLQEQHLSIPRAIDGNAANCTEVLVNTARAFSVRLALYQAVWELVAAGELIPAETTNRWQP